MKAYAVCTEFSEGSALVFAPNARFAKKLAYGTDALAGEDWIALRVYREPKADQYAGEVPRICMAESLDDQRIMRQLGWFEVDGCLEVCCTCQLYPWEELPESQLKSKGDPGEGIFICHGCSERI